MKRQMDAGTVARSDGPAMRVSSRCFPNVHVRSFCIRAGFAFCIALTGCSKSPSDATTTMTGGGSQSGGSQSGGSQSGGSQSGGSQSGGSQSIGPQGEGGKVGSTSVLQSTAPGSGGASPTATDGGSFGGSMSSMPNSSSGGHWVGGSSSVAGIALGGKIGSAVGGSSSQSGASHSGGAEAIGGNSRGTGGGTGFAGGPNTGATSAAAAGVTGNPQRMILCDEGNQRIAYLDTTKSTAGWQSPISGLRDIQLVGDNRLGVSTPTGYLELDLGSGTVKKEVKGFSSVQSLRRLPNGNTILGMETNGTTLQELDSKDVPVATHKVSFPTLGNFRLFRRTPQGTFLIGAGNKVAEVNWSNETVWEMTFPGSNLYVYQAVRLADGKLAVSQGYGSSLLIVDPSTKKVLTTIGGTQQPDASTILPNFFAGFQVLPNGHFVITNWQGHGTGNGGKGIQLLEYDDTGKLVWKWKQDPNLVSSLHHIVVLDGLDTTKLHDDSNGALAPVTQ